MKKAISLFLAIVITLSLSCPAFAIGSSITEGAIKVAYINNINANQGIKARERGRKTAQKSRECKYVANKSHNTLLRCLRQ